VSSCENDSVVRDLEFPLPLPQPPKKITIHNLSQTSPYQISHHQCAYPGIDSIDSPHPRIQCIRPLEKVSHPEPSTEHVLTSSRTRISIPLVILREQRPWCSPSPPSATRSCVRAMGHDYPSPGTNPTIYPSSLPLV
jgi:hypothetical protein